MTEGVLPGALDGIRVVDLSTWIQGPLAAARLADMGADVVKVEPAVGDFNRYYGRRADGFCAVFEVCNRNKRSIILDLKDARCMEALHRLLATADVLVENFRPGAMERLGLGWPDLHERYPRLVVAKATGFGIHGPESARAAFDLVACARGGILIGQGRTYGEPRRPLSPTADLIAARDLASAVVLALFARERSGKGQHIVSSLLGSQVAFQAIAISDYLHDGLLRPNGNSPHPNGSSTSTWYATSDAKWIVFSLLDPTFWPNLCRALGHAELIDDARFATAQSRFENDSELRELLGRIVATRTREQWLAAMAEHDVPGGPVFDYDEVVTDPQVLENGYLVPFEHPFYGGSHTVGWGFSLSGTPGSVRMPAPELGQHTGEILESLGYSEQQVAALTQRGLDSGSPPGW